MVVGVAVEATRESPAVRARAFADAAECRPRQRPPGFVRPRHNVGLSGLALLEHGIASIAASAFETERAREKRRSRIPDHGRNGRSVTRRAGVSVAAGVRGFAG